MRGGIHEPRGMEADHGTQKNTPQETRPSADGQCEHSQSHNRHPMVIGDPHMKFMFAKVGNVGQEVGSIAMHSLAGNDPTDMRPDASLSRRVRITFLVCVLVANAVSGYPGDGAALHGERAANGQEILHPDWRLVTAMRQ